MGCNGDRNRYGFIALVFLGVGASYFAIANAASYTNISSLAVVSQIFALIHFPLTFCCYYNRKYIFGTRQIVINTTSWEETTAYYGGYVYSAKIREDVSSLHSALTHLDEKRPQHMVVPVLKDVACVRP